MYNRPQHSTQFENSSHNFTQLYKKTFLSQQHFNSTLQHLFKILQIQQNFEKKNQSYTKTLHNLTQLYRIIQNFPSIQNPTKLFTTRHKSAKVHTILQIFTKLHSLQNLT